MQEISKEIKGKGSRYRSARDRDPPLLHFSFMSEDSDQEVVLPTVLSSLTNVIDSDLHNFAFGSATIQSAALSATKFLFDLGEHRPFTRKSNGAAVSLVVDLGSLVLS